MNRKIILKTFSRTGKPSRILSIQEQQEDLTAKLKISVLDCKEKLGKSYPLIHAFTKLIDGSLENRNDFYKQFIAKMGSKLPQEESQTDNEIQPNPNEESGPESEYNSDEDSDCDVDSEDDDEEESGVEEDDEDEEENHQDSEKETPQPKIRSRSRSLEKKIN